VRLSDRQIHHRDANLFPSAPKRATRHWRICACTSAISSWVADCRSIAIVAHTYCVGDIKSRNAFLDISSTRNRL